MCATRYGKLHGASMPGCPSRKRPLTGGSYTGRHYTRSNGAKGSREIPWARRRGGDSRIKLLHRVVGPSGGDLRLRTSAAFCGDEWPFGPPLGWADLQQQRALATYNLIVVEFA